MNEYVVVVAIANPNTVGKLIHIACTVAKEHDGRVVVTTVVPSPDDSPENSPHPHDLFSEAQALLDRAEAVVNARGVACDCRVAVGRHIHEGIVDVAEAHNADLLVIGMSESAHPTLQHAEDFDRIVDAVAAHSPCHLLVAKFRDGIHFDRVLVPIASSTDLDLTHDIVVPLRHQEGADIDFVHFVAEQNQTDQGWAELTEWLRQASLLEYGHVSIEVAPEPAAAIAQASSRYDAVVLGTPPLYVLQRKLLGALAEQVITEAHCSTLVMRARDVG